MPTTAAVSATGSHVDAVLRKISVINSPTISLAAKGAQVPKAGLVACTLLAGGGRLRVPMRSLCQSAIRGSAKALFFSDLFTWRQRCDFPARNEPLDGSFSKTCASSRPKRPRLLAEMEAVRGLPRAASCISNHERNGNHLLSHPLNPGALNRVSAAPDLRIWSGPAGTTKEALSLPFAFPSGQGFQIPPDQISGGSDDPDPSSRCM